MKLIKLKEMINLKKFMDESCVKSIKNGFGETIETMLKDTSARLIFSNGLYVHINKLSDSEEYSLAVADYNCFFDWNILHPFKHSHKFINGAIITSDETEIINICSAVNNF